MPLSGSFSLPESKRLPSHKPLPFSSNVIVPAALGPATTPSRAKAPKLKTISFMIGILPEGFRPAVPVRVSHHAAKPRLEVVGSAADPAGCRDFARAEPRP